jgi:hypothetical protein
VALIRGLGLGLSAASGPDQPFIDRLARSFGGNRWTGIRRAAADAANRVADCVSPPEVAGGEVSLSTLTRDRIAGRLTFGNSGLLFDSQVPDRLHPRATIHTLDQRELVNLSADKSDLTIRFGGVTTTRMARADLRPLHEERSEQNQITLPPEMIQDGRRFIDEFFGSREYALLPELSYALGLAGATGQRYRPSLALHSLGMSAAGLLGVNPASPGVSYIWKYPPWLRALYHNINGVFEGFTPSGCWSGPEEGPNYEGLPQCPKPCVPYPDRAHDCFGMCGPGCDCWSWVCGDCCYHDFCADHDALLRQCIGSPDLVACVASVEILAGLIFGCDGGLW